MPDEIVVVSAYGFYHPNHPLIRYPGPSRYRTSWAFTQTVPQNVALAYSVCLGPAENEYAAFYTDKKNSLHYSMSRFLRLSQAVIGR